MKLFHIAPPTIRMLLIFEKAEHLLDRKKLFQLNLHYVKNFLMELIHTSVIQVSGA